MSITAKQFCKKKKNLSLLQELYKWFWRLSNTHPYLAENKYTALIQVDAILYTSKIRTKRKL